MSSPEKIALIEALASSVIGDGQTPDLFFVTDRGAIITITRSFSRAKKEWQELAAREPRTESALENRTIGVICYVAPISDEPDSELRIWDHSSMLEAPHVPQ